MCDSRVVLMRRRSDVITDCYDMMEERVVPAATIRWLVLAFCAAFWLAVGYGILS